MKRKSVLHWTVWRRKEKLTIKRLILRLIWSLILTLTRKIRMKTVIPIISIFFKLRISILAILVTVTQITYALIVTFIMLMHVSLSVFFEFECLNELTNCDSISKWVNKDLKISNNVLIDEDQLILNTLNVDWLNMM